MRFILIRALKRNSGRIFSREDKYVATRTGCNNATSGGRLRQFVSIAACAAFLSSCIGSGVEKGQTGFVEGFFGGVAADDPRAALVGRDVLTAGGTAADAAVAMYFTLAVTLPSSAGLGGGGVCLVRDGKKGVTEALDFTPVAGTGLLGPNARPAATPGNPRGFFALHAKYGGLRWERLIAPAENFSRFGHQVSRAFVTDLEGVSSALFKDQSSKNVFATKDGLAAGEGDFVTQINLAATLSLIRSKGPGPLYQGPLARAFVEGANEAGAGLTLEDMRKTLPVWRKTLPVEVKGFTRKVAHFAPPPAAAGLVEAEIFSLLQTGGRYDGAGEGVKAHVMADTQMRAFADRGRWLSNDGTVIIDPTEVLDEKHIEALGRSFSSDRKTTALGVNPQLDARQENTSGTGFVAIDQYGSAVACAVTMNNLFGTGRIAGDTGILIAARPGSNGRGPLSLGPVMVVNDHTKKLFFAGAAAGGVTAASSLSDVLAGTIIEQKTLKEAIERPRLHHSGIPDTVYYEPRYHEAGITALKERGHDVVAARTLGRVNAAFCGEGLPGASETCEVMTDPRGYGLAVSANQQ